MTLITEYRNKNGFLKKSELEQSFCMFDFEEFAGAQIV